MNEQELRKQIAERCYWDYMGQDEKWHPMVLRTASEDMKKEMYGRAYRILALIKQACWLKGEGELPHGIDNISDFTPEDAECAGRKAMKDAGWKPCQEWEK